MRERERERERLREREYHDSRMISKYPLMSYDYHTVLELISVLTLNLWTLGVMHVGIVIRVSSINYGVSCCMAASS